MVKASTHVCRIRAFPPNVSVYMTGISGVFTYKTFGVNPENNLSDTIIIKEQSSGSITTSAALDAYNNKACLHQYADFDGDLSLTQIPGLTFRSSENDYGYCTEYIRNGSVYIRQYNLGKGPIVANQQYTIVDQADSLGFKSRTFINGKHWSTYTEDVSVFEILLSGPKPTAHFVLTCKTKYEKAALEYNPNLKDSFRSVDKIVGAYLLGVTQDLPQATLSGARDVMNDVLSIRYPSHIAPDNIIDDIHEKLVIPDVNNIENLKDLKKIRENLPPILNLLKKRDFKSLAEFYLWYKYSYQTTKLDLKAYYNFFQKWALQANSKSDKMKVYLTYADSNNQLGESKITRYHIICDTYNAGVLQTLGLEINLSNAWDLLPFSFVVDWFVNLGDIFARIDNYDIVSKLRIHTVVTSTKYTRVFQPLLALGCASSCRQTCYRRDVNTVIPLGNLALSLKNPGTHLLDGSALYVANKRS